MIRVLLADDHEIVRSGLRLLIDGQSDMRVIAEAATGEEAIAQVRAARPDVVVLDLTMPGISGFSGLIYLRAQYPAIPVVIVSASDDGGTIRRSLG